MALHEWERVAEGQGAAGSGEKTAGCAFFTDRMTTPTGWIYRTYRFYFNQASESSVFVPFPAPVPRSVREVPPDHQFGHTSPKRVVVPRARVLGEVA
jgi:hypothetical protein